MLVYYPPPRPSRKRTALLAGAVAAMGVLVTTAAAVLAVGVVVWEIGGLGASAAERGHQTYEGWFLCRDVDVSAAVAILPLAEAESWENPREDRRELGTVRQIDCSFDLSEAGAFGTVWIRTVVAEQASDAATWHVTRVEEEALEETSDTIEDLDGPWQEGVLALGIGREPAPGRAAAGAEICVLDHNLQLCVRFHYSSAPDPPPGVPSDHDLADATHHLVERMLLLAR